MFSEHNGLVLTHRSSLRSNKYQAEESETWIGEWLAQHPDRRDEMVVATRYAEDWKTYLGPRLTQSNYGGNSAKSLHISVYG